MKQRIKTLKLSEITKPLENEVMLKMMADAVQRILKAERSAALGGVTTVRTKIITTLAASFSRKVRDGELWESLMYVLNGICPPSCDCISCSGKYIAE